jgi:outer membrane usher protein
VVLLSLALALGPAPPVRAQSTAQQLEPGDDPLIATVRANGVARGELSVVRKRNGDFWLAASDLARLQVAPNDAALRRLGGESYYSLRALGAVRLELDEAQLLLHVDFPTASMQGSRIDLSSRPPPAQLTEPGASLILSYRLSTRRTGQDQRAQTTLENDLNVRIGPVLLRQEMRLDTASARRLSRGVTQAVMDDREKGRRFIAGDLVSTAGAFGSTVTGAGVMVSRLFDLTPDLIRQPTVTLQGAAALPAEVEVAVDGSPLFRTNVGPGPIRLDNLLLYGGTRNVRLTITDAAGRREVIEQPFLFTDSVLAKGLHEYSYFAGKRSMLGADNQWHYLEPAWQAFHRYGLNDHVTVGAGGEGSPDFTNVGAGIALRSDRLGLASLELLASRDRVAPARALGWSARYTYTVPQASFFVSRRQFGEGFRTFTTTAAFPFLRSETRLGVATRFFAGTLGLELGRSVDALETRDTRTLRYSTNFGRRTTLAAELQSTRLNGRRENSAYVFLRFDLDGQYWVGSTAKATGNGRTLDVEAGKVLPQGEGLGWRIGANTSAQSGQDASAGFVTAQWNLAPASLEFFGSAPLRGAGGRYTEVAVSGALVGVDGFWGLTRRVSDGFVLARLGVPQPGVEILVNNQVQGRTNEAGNAFIPQIGAFGRQDVSVNEKQLGMEFNLLERRRTIVPAYRSGTVVDFGGKKIRALAGMAWLGTGPHRKPVAARAWELSAGNRTVTVETGSAGDFYLEDVAPGRYTGFLEAGDRRYACRMDVPEFSEVVHELKEGIVCE